MSPHVGTVPCRDQFIRALLGLAVGSIISELFSDPACAVRGSTRCQVRASGRGLVPLPTEG